ncbi:hypothetical protein HAPAU_16320 [Halalkalicoccus paucihalophilus]|uniref:Uncharacterized protein n=1 Tax=Halalkalicoccus paucihalophilus TaxID=1008153 RepID=A0A151AFZ5_9EURY|nr:hypothetical protein [Halalkalicoccus paucihalophilus]KYH26533.1 hypothetical protein HAPAU_16320 [Halalkalicoccus paucihalophilus]
MVTVVPIALALVAALIAVELLSQRALKRYGEGLGSMPTVVLEEFPGISPELLRKYTSFDPELGWVPQPDQQKQKDTGDHLPGEEVESVVTYSTDEYGSRVCPAADREEGRGAVSTYGDSYCFCREVDDEDTFQNHFARTIDSHVANYGGGNYGLDQALLRMKRQYPEDPTDHVCMVVTASSIARILSVWKHYQEFGNVLAVKPRYELRDGELELVESPVDEKEDLLALEARADFLRTHDDHYENWFKPHLAGFPYATDFLDDPDQVKYALYAAGMDLESEYGISIPGIDFGARQAATTLRLEQSRVRYHERLFDLKADLFDALIGEFVDYANEHDFTPTFVMVQQLRYATYEADHGPIYGDLMDHLDERYPELETIDMAEHLSGDPESLYVQRGEGGHYSPETNEQIAEVLESRLID